MIGTYTPEEISVSIIKMAKAIDSTYIDAVISYCDNNNIEVEDINKFLTAGLVAKIEKEAEQLNLLNCEVSRLNDNLFMDN